jgi:sugar lactone lactonase YvrE
LNRRVGRFDREAGATPGDFGRYRVGSELRSNAARTVYAARQNGGDRRVELHVASRDQEDFLTHAHRLSVLDDPYLLPVYEVGVHDGRAYAASAPGRETLEERLREGPLPYERALRLAGDLVTPLETLAKAGMPVDEIPASAVALQGERALLAPLEIEAPNRHRRPASSGVALARMIRSMLGSEDAPEELEALLADPPASAVDLLREARSISAPRRRMPRVPLRAVAVAAALALGLSILVFLLTRGESNHTATPAAQEPQPSPSSAAGRLTATIPLRVQPTSVAVDGNAVWVATTAGTLVRVDPGTNAVAGAPIKVAGKVEHSTVRAGEGALFLATGSRLFRVDPASGKVTARRQIDGIAQGMTVAGGSVWVTRIASPKSRDRSSTLQRFDAHTLAPVGGPLRTEAFPQDVDVSGHTAWVANSAAGSVTQADTARGTSTHSTIGSFPGAGVVSAGKYWVTDDAGHYVTEIDAATGRHEGIVRVPGAVSITAGGGSLWVTSEDSDGAGRIVRVDPVTRRVIGRPVDVGRGIGWPVFGHGSVWVYSGSKRALVRIEPASPAPAARPARPTRADALLPGPLSPGTKTSAGFALPFSVDLEGDGWLGITAGNAYASVSRTTPTRTGIALVLPSARVRPDGSASKIASAEGLVRELRRDPRLTVTLLPAPQVGGAPAIPLKVTVRSDAAPVPSYCDRVCAPVLTAGTVTLTVDEGVDQELRIFDRGGRVVVASLAAPAGSPELARMRATLDTVRFR